MSFHIMLPTTLSNEQQFTNSEHNKLLGNVYKYVKHYFDHVDKELYFQDDLLEETTSLYNKMSKFKYTFYRKKCVPMGGECTIMRFGDILAGLYFPHNNVGDKIKILVNDHLEFNITITDKNKIYLPINDEHFMHIRYLYFSGIRVRSALPFYSVKIALNDYDKLPYTLNIVFRISNENKYLLYGGGTCIKLNYSEIGDYEIVDKYEIFDKDEPSIITIQKTWRDYKERCSIFHNIWKNNIRDVNMSIKYLPDIGIEYFNTMDHYKSIL